MFVIGKNQHCVLPIPSKKYENTFDLVLSHSIILKKDMVTKIDLNLLFWNTTHERVVICDRYGEIAENYIDMEPCACEKFQELTLTVKSRYDHVLYKGSVLAQLLILKSV